MNSSGSHTRCYKQTRLGTEGKCWSNLRTSVMTAALGFGDSRVGCSLGSQMRTCSHSAMNCGRCGIPIRPKSRNSASSTSGLLRDREGCPVLPGSLLGRGAPLTPGWLTSGCGALCPTRIAFAQYWYRLCLSGRADSRSAGIPSAQSPTSWLGAKTRDIANGAIVRPTLSVNTRSLGGIRKGESGGRREASGGT